MIFEITSENQLWIALQNIFKDLPDGWRINISIEGRKTEGVLFINLESDFGHNSTRSVGLGGLAEEITNTVEYAVEQNEIHTGKTR